MVSVPFVGSGIGSVYLAKVGGPTIPVPVQDNSMIPVPGPGRYSLIVVAQGPWALAFEFGNSVQW